MGGQPGLAWNAWVSQDTGPTPSGKKAVPPPPGALLYRLAEVSDAPDLEGARGLGTVHFEIDAGAGHFGQGHAVPDGGLRVQGLSGSHGWEKGGSRPGSWVSGWTKRARDRLEMV